MWGILKDGKCRRCLFINDISTVAELIKRPMAEAMEARTRLDKLA